MGVMNPLQAPTCQCAPYRDRKFHHDRPPRHENNERGTSVLLIHIHVVAVLDRAMTDRPIDTALPNLTHLQHRQVLQIIHPLPRRITPLCSPLPRMEMIPEMERCALCEVTTPLYIVWRRPVLRFRANQLNSNTRIIPHCLFPFDHGQSILCLMRVWKAWVSRRRPMHRWHANNLCTRSKNRNEDDHLILIASTTHIQILSLVTNHSLRVHHRVRHPVRRRVLVQRRRLCQCLLPHVRVQGAQRTQQMVE